MAKRKYTGWDGNASGYRKGTEQLKRWVLFLNGGKIKNYGSFQIRPAGGDKTKWSVHGTGRAVDYGYSNREDGLALIDFFVRNAEALGVELVNDYVYGKHGRTWKCDREAWVEHKKNVIGRGGNWVHVEISNAVADDPAYVDAVIACLLSPVKDA